MSGWRKYWNDKSSLAKEHEKLDWGSEESMLNVHRAVIKSLKITDNIRVLDTGCGTGNLEKLLSGVNSSLEIYGLEIVKKLVKICSRKSIGNSKFALADTGSIPFRNNFFDVTISIGVLHASDAPAHKIIGELSRVTKPGGQIVITCANREFGNGYKIIRRDDFRYFDSGFFEKNFKRNDIKLAEIGSVSTLNGEIGPVERYHNLIVKGVKGK